MPTTISVSTTLDTAFLNNASKWPITVTAPVTITFSGGTAALTSASCYFILTSPGVVLDGLQSYARRFVFVVTNVAGYTGLVRNGTSAANGYSNAVVTNLVVAVSGSASLAVSAGWIGQAYFGKGASGCVFTRCSSSGRVAGANSGGIVGRYASSLTVRACYGTGNITGSGAGGIVGANASSVSVLECYSIGSGSRSIVGTGAGGTTVSNCFGRSSSGGNTVSNYYSYTAWDAEKASQTLLGAPLFGTESVGSVWVNLFNNLPFYLVAFSSSYSPPAQTISAGGSTTPGPVSGAYLIAGIDGYDYPSSSTALVINASNGILTASPDYPDPATRSVLMYCSTNGYYVFLSLALTVVTAPPAPGPALSPVVLSTEPCLCTSCVVPVDSFLGIEYFDPVLTVTYHSLEVSVNTDGGRAFLLTLGNASVSSATRRVFATLWKIPLDCTVSSLNGENVSIADLPYFLGDVQGYMIINNQAYGITDSALARLVYQTRTAVNFNFITEYDFSSVTAWYTDRPNTLYVRMWLYQPAP